MSRVPLFDAGRIGNNAGMGLLRRFPVLHLATVAAVAMALLLAGCASTRPDRRVLHDTLYGYSSAIRWGELDAALSYVDPDYLASHPLSTLERQRFKQLQVSGYYVRTTEDTADGNLRQTVEIRLVNRHTQTERSIVDHQVWRWDPEQRRWWLTTGLPDLAPGD